MEPEDHVQWNTSFSSEATTSTEATEASAWEKLIFQDETGLVRHDGLPATEPAIQGPDRPSTGPSGFQRAERVSRKTRIEIHALYRLGDRSIRELARLFSLSRSTVQHILAHPSTPRHTRQSHGYDNHPIKFQVLDFITTGGAFARRMALEEIPEHLGLSISERTVRRILRSEGYGRYVARAKPYLSPAQKLKRLEFALKYRYWREEWKRVIFSDEAAMQNGDTSFHVTRKAGEEYLDECLQPKFKKLEGTMVWAAITYGGKTELINFDRRTMGNSKGNMDSQAYIDHILPVFYDFWKSMELPEEDRDQDWQPVFCQQDNARPHTSKLTSAWIKQANMPFIDWPSNSPDLNPIEHVWSILKTAVRKRLRREGWNVANLIAFAEQEWAKIPQHDIDWIIESMPDRMEGVIEAQGGHTRW